MDRRKKALNADNIMQLYSENSKMCRIINLMEVKMFPICFCC